MRPNPSPPSKPSASAYRGRVAKRSNKQNTKSIAETRAVERHTQQEFTVTKNALFRSVLPDRFHCVLKYCSSKQYTTGVGGVVGAKNTFRLNGLFDPDITGVGHQPYGFDQITPFFSVYTVRSAWANITVSGVDDASSYLAYAFTPSLSTTNPVGMGIEQISESDETNFVMLGASTSGVPNQQIKLPRIDLPKLEGLSWEAFYGNINQRAAVTANPGQGAQFHVAIGNAAGNAAKVATLTIEIFFDAYFEGRMSMPQS